MSRQYIFWTIALQVIASVLAVLVMRWYDKRNPT